MKSADSLTPDALARVLKEIPILRMWADAVEAHALAMLLRGETVPGYKLVAGRANRVWAFDEQGVRDRLLPWLDEDDVSPRSLISPAQAEKLLRSKKLNQIIELLAMWAPKRTGAPTIALEQDPRPEIPSVSEFTDALLT